MDFFYLTGRTGWELSAAQARRLYAEKAVMPSANPPIVPTHSSTAPLPALQTHLTRGFSTQTKMPTTIETLPSSPSSSSPSGWRLPPFFVSSCGLTFNFTSNLTPYVRYLLPGMNSNNDAIRTHPFSSKSAEFQLFRLARHPPPTCHHHGYILPANFKRRTQKVPLNAVSLRFLVTSRGSLADESMVAVIHTRKVNTGIDKGENKGATCQYSITVQCWMKVATTNCHKPFSPGNTSR